MDSVVKNPKHLWVVGILALLWMSMGAFDYVMTQSKVEWYLSQFTPEELAYFNAIPTWTVATWAISIWSGFIAAILLLFRNRLAVPLFWLSLATFVITAIQNYFLAAPNMYEVIGSFAVYFSIVIGIICVLLLWYAIRMKARGVLR